MNTRHGFRIFSVRGIPIRIHYTFLLVLPFLAYAFGRSFAERRTADLSVVDQDRLVGTVSRFDVARALRLQGLLASQHPGMGPSQEQHA